MIRNALAIDMYLHCAQHHANITREKNHADS